MKHIKIKELSVSILIFTLLGISISLISSFISEYELLQKVGNEYYTKHAISFDINSNKQDIQVENILKNIKKGQVLYREIGKNTRLVYFNSNKYIIPIIEGRTFNKRDFTSSKKMVIVGKNRIEEYDEQEVIGKLGFEFESKLDDLAIILLNGNLEDELIDGSWVIDGKNAEGSYNKIYKEVGSLNGTIEKMHKDDNSISRLFKNNKINIIIYIFIIFTFLSCLLVYMYLILISKKEDIKVMIICGFKRDEILRECFERKIMISIVFYIIGVTLSSLILKYRYNYTVSYNIIILTTITMIILCSIILFLFQKLWINKYIRRLRNDF